MQMSLCKLLHPKRKTAIKMLLIMKFTAAFLLIACLQGYAQKVTLSLKNAPLKKAFNQIKEQTGFSFLWDEAVLKKATPVSISVKDVSIEEALNACLKDQPLTYNISDKLVVIKAKPAAPAVTQAEAKQAARPIKLTGTVLSQDNGPLAGASVTVKGAAAGTSTDANGKFSLEAESSGVLVVSFVGYTTKEVAFSKWEDMLITLTQAEKTADEVVVVGYGTQKKKDLTGAVSSVNSDHMNIGGSTANIAQALQGRAAGVRVQQTDFSPGGAISVTVRGGNSVSTTNEPLYVVDGFITDNGKYLNPNDIEDIQILKDASATAIYGARGGNGVVLITTKKGQAGKMQISADAYTGNQYATYNPSLLNGRQYADYQNALAVENGSPAPYPSSVPVYNTNWWDLATQQASVKNLGLTMSGNDKNSKLYLSANYFNQTGILKKTGLERYSARMGGEKKFTDKVKVGANFYGSNADNRQMFFPANITAPLFNLITANPANKVYNDDGTYYRPGGRDNALALVLEPTNNSTSRLINGNIYGDYEIIKNLTYHLSGGAEFAQTTLGRYIPRTLVNGQANGGIAMEQMSTSLRWLVEQYLNYKHSFGVHSINALIGTSSQKDVNEYVLSGARNFSTDAFLYYNINAGGTYSGVQSQGWPTNNPASSRIDTKLGSYYGRLNYAFRDRVLATFTLRDDISSRFGPNNRHGIFPSGALAWRLSDEKFLKSVTALSNLKLRASYGITGNDRIGDYAYLARYTPYSTTLSTGSNLSAGVEPATSPNSNLKWESTAQADIGIDAGFFNNRLNVTVDFYSKKTTDMLLSLPIGSWWGAGTTGSTSPGRATFGIQTANSGSMENKGVELSISSDNIKRKDLLWNTTFNLAYNKQKTLSLSNGVKIISTSTAGPSGSVAGLEFSRLEPGKEMGVIYGYQYDGVIKTGETYAAQPLSKAGDPKYVDRNNDGKITPDDRTYLGNTNPRLIAALGNNFQYKGFNLDVFFQGAFNYSLFNMNRMVLESSTGTDVLNRWVAGKNENTDIPRNGYYTTVYGSYVNSRFVENASYIRLKTMTLGYNLPVHLVKQIKFIDGFNIYVTGQNLLTFTKYTGTDPEVNGHSDNNIGGGIDFNAFPGFRTFTFGLRLTIH